MVLGTDLAVVHGFSMWAVGFSEIDLGFGRGDGRPGGALRMVQIRHGFGEAEGRGRNMTGALVVFWGCRMGTW